MTLVYVLWLHLPAEVKKPPDLLLSEAIKVALRRGVCDHHRRVYSSDTDLTEIS